MRVKNKLTNAGVLLLLLVLSFLPAVAPQGASSPSSVTAITILSPNGGERIPIGRELEIRWTATGETNSTQIILIRTLVPSPDISSQLIAQDVVVHSGTNTFRWRVPVAEPSLVLNQEQFSLRIVDLETGVYDDSNARFSFVPEGTTIVPGAPEGAVGNGTVPPTGTLAAPPAASNPPAQICNPIEGATGKLCPAFNLEVGGENFQITRASCSAVASDLFTYTGCSSRNIEISYDQSGFEGCTPRNFLINKWAIQSNQWVPVNAEQIITVARGIPRIQVPFAGDGIYAVLAQVGSGCEVSTRFACPADNVLFGELVENRVRAGEALTLQACNLLRTPLKVSFIDPTPANNGLVNNAQPITIEVAANRVVERAFLHLRYTSGTETVETQGALHPKGGSFTVFSYTFPRGSILPLTYTYWVMVVDRAGNEASTGERVGTVVGLGTETPFIFNSISLHSIQESEQLFALDQQGNIVETGQTGIVYRFVLTPEDGQPIRFRSQENVGGVGAGLNHIVEKVRERVLGENAGSVVEVRYNNLPIGNLLQNELVNGLVQNPGSFFNFELFVDGRKARFVSATQLPVQANKPAMASLTLRIEGREEVIRDIVLIIDGAQSIISQSSRLVFIKGQLKDSCSTICNNARLSCVSAHLAGFGFLGGRTTRYQPNSPFSNPENEPGLCSFSFEDLLSDDLGDTRIICGCAESINEGSGSIIFTEDLAYGYIYGNTCTLLGRRCAQAYNPVTGETVSCENPPVTPGIQTVNRICSRSGGLEGYSGDIFLYPWYTEIGGSRQSCSNVCSGQGLQCEKAYDSLGREVSCSTIYPPNSLEADKGTTCQCKRR